MILVNPSWFKGMLGVVSSPFQLSVKSKHDASPKASTSALPEARDVTIVLYRLAVKPVFTRK